MTREEFLKSKNFNSNGVTIAYVGGDSYARRAELKAAGWSYDKVIGWHIAEVEDMDEENMKEVLFEQVFQWDGNPKTGHCYRENAETHMKMLRQRPSNTKSQFQGEPGQRFRNQKVTVVMKRQFDGAYGTSEIIKFQDAAENLYTWFTNTYPDIEEGDEIEIDFTVKKHDTYNGENITYITRAKIK